MTQAKSTGLFLPQLPKAWYSSPVLHCQGQLTHRSSPPPTTLCSPGQSSRPAGPGGTCVGILAVSGCSAWRFLLQNARQKTPACFQLKQSQCRHNAGKRNASLRAPVLSNVAHYVSIQTTFLAMRTVRYNKRIHNGNRYFFW